MKLKILFASFIFTQIASATDIVIYDASTSPMAPVTGKGTRVLINGNKVGSLIGRLLVTNQAREASDTFSKVYSYYRNTFNRDSYDGKGATINAIVRAGAWPIDALGMKQNAAWVAPYKVFVFGSGSGHGLKGFSTAVDVIGHEFTHAVIETTSQLEYSGQSGALNEHLADFFGEAIQLKSGLVNPGYEFLIGESTLSQEIKDEFSAKYGRPVRGLRDMRNPQLGLSPQPSHMSEIPAEYKPGCTPTGSNDNCGVHLLSGIPNRATVLMVDALGIQLTERIIYNTMVSRLTKNSNFSDYRDQLIQECRSEPIPQNLCNSISNAFFQVGL